MANRTSPCILDNVRRVGRHSRRYDVVGGSSGIGMILRNYIQGLQLTSKESSSGLAQGRPERRQLGGNIQREQQCSDIDS